MSNTEEKDSWSKEAEYDQHIAPVMKALIDLCMKHEIPFVATFQYGPEDVCTSCNTKDPKTHLSLVRMVNLVYGSG